jgi:hypothetical protein
LAYALGVIRARILNSQSTSWPQSVLEGITRRLDALEPERVRELPDGKTVREYSRETVAIAVAQWVLSNPGDAIHYFRSNRHEEYRVWRRWKQYRKGNLPPSNRKKRKAEKMQWSRRLRNGTS